MQMKLLSGFKTMMHNTFCTLINNKWLFLSWRCLDHWQASFFWYLRATWTRLLLQSWTKIFKLFSFLLLFLNFKSFKIFELSVKACLNPGQSLIGFPVVLLDGKPKMILTLCWFCPLVPQSCDPWTGSLWVCLGFFFKHKRVTLQCGNSISRSSWKKCRMEK